MSVRTFLRSRLGTFYAPVRACYRWGRDLLKLFVLPTRVVRRREHELFIADIQAQLAAMADRIDLMEGRQWDSVATSRRLADLEDRVTELTQSEPAEEGSVRSIPLPTAARATRIA